MNIKCEDCTEENNTIDKNKSAPVLAENITNAKKYIQLTFERDKIMQKINSDIHDIFVEHDNYDSFGGIEFKDKDLGRQFGSINVIFKDDGVSMYVITDIQQYFNKLGYLHYNRQDGKIILSFMLDDISRGEK